MPGIAGMIAPMEQVSLPRVLSGMIEGVRARQSVEIKQWNCGPAGFAAAGQDAQSMLAERSGVCLALAGSIVHDAQLAERLAASTMDISYQNSAECLLEMYIDHGSRALEGLNGKYAAAVWDGPRGRLTIVNGRGGLEPLYYWHSGSRLIFASRLAGLAAHPGFPSRVNPTAVMDLLAAGQMLDERTLYSAALAIPPAVRLTFEGNKLCVESYWQPALYAPGDPAPEEDEAMEVLATMVNTAVQRQIISLDQGCAGAANTTGIEEKRSNAFCLLLTGGLDSRLLAGVLARVDQPGRACAVTIGHNRARDVRYGQRIAAAANMDYTVIPSNPRFLADYAAECVRRSEGNMQVHASWILGASPFLKQNALSAVMSGVGAETVSGRHWLAEQNISSRKEALAKLCDQHWGYLHAVELLRPELRAAAAEASRESLRRTLAEAPAEHLLGWADYLAFRQSRRHPTGNILADDARVLEPFYDNDLLDYAYHLPPSMRIKGRLYKRMIIQHFPEMAAIEYTDSGMLLLDELKGRVRRHNYKDDFLRIYYQAARRISRQAPFLHLPALSDNPAHAVYQNTWLRTASQDFALRLIDKQDAYADILDAAAVRQLVADHMSGKTDAYRLVSAVLTFILWRETARA